jgi:hypothetical protein
MFDNHFTWQDFDKAWPIYDSAQSREFRKVRKLFNSPQFFVCTVMLYLYIVNFFIFWFLVGKKDCARHYKRARDARCITKEQFSGFISSHLLWA